MRFKEVKYERLTQVGGSFQNARIGVVVEVESGDDEDEVMARARRFVHQQLRFIGASAITLPEDEEVE